MRKRIPEYPRSEAVVHFYCISMHSFVTVAHLLLQFASVQRASRDCTRGGSICLYASNVSVAGLSTIRLLNAHVMGQLSIVIGTIRTAVISFDRLRLA